MRDYSVIWLPGANRDTACHRLKLTSHGLSLVRLKHRFGIRVLSTEEAAFRELRPNEEFMKVAVTKIYRLHPLPHGLQRLQVSQLLREWKWQAEPLQPARGSAEGSSWEVGAAVEPPNNIMPAFQRDVLISLIKDRTGSGKAPNGGGSSTCSTPFAIPGILFHKYGTPNDGPMGVSWTRSLGQLAWHGSYPTPAPAKRYEKLADQLKTDLHENSAETMGRKTFTGPIITG